MTDDGAGITTFEMVSKADDILADIASEIVAPTIGTIAVRSNVIPPGRWIAKTHFGSNAQTHASCCVCGATDGDMNVAVASCVDPVT